MKITNLIILAALTMSTTAVAENGRPASKGACAELIKECFAYRGDEQTTCFSASSRHPFCQGSELGSLAAKRYTMTPSVAPGEENAPGFLGPNLIDKDCLANFDSQFSAALINGSTSADGILQLSHALDSCRVDISNDILRQ